MAKPEELRERGDDSDRSRHHAAQPDGSSRPILAIERVRVDGTTFVVS